MDINTYKLFATVAETGNISYAAELTGYTQSGISHSIKRMEKELNLQLFVRDRYGVHLTPVGREFLQKVRLLLSENEKLEQFIYDIQGVEVGSLNIGSFSSVSVNWLPDIIDKFNIAHPNIIINIKEGGINELHDWVINSQVDFSFSEIEDNKDVEYIHLVDDRYLAIFSHDYYIEDNISEFPIKKFENENFILPELSYNHNIYDILKKEKVQPKIKFTSQNDYTIMSFVENNLGVSIEPELVIEKEKHRFQFLPLNPFYFRKLGISMKKFIDLSPAAKTFIYFIGNYFNVPINILKNS